MNHSWLSLLHGRRGAVLVISYLFMTVIAALVSTMMVRSLNEQRIAQRYARLASGFYLAEAGLDDAISWMRSQPSPPAGTVCFDPFSGNGCANPQAQALGPGTYTVTIDPNDNNPISYIDLYDIAVTGLVTGDTTVVRRILGILRTESFSRYSYFTNLERMASGTPIWFTSNNTLQGPVHSNAQFNIAGSPVFNGPVSSAAASINYRTPPPAGGNNPQFNGGLSLGASTVQLPLSSTALRVAASAASGQWYTGNTTIVMQSSSPCGSLQPPCLLVTNPALGWTNQPRSLPANGAIFVNGGNAKVSGTLDGQLTIGSSHDAVISNHVRYADNPQTNPASNDVLGLVAERNVVIAWAAPDNLTIQASIMALNESFTVENWWVGPPQGTLSIYGGIIQGRRGPVGTFNGSTGTILSGYAKNYQYDARLSNMAPPHYPTTGTYNLVHWKEE